MIDDDAPQQEPDPTPDMNQEYSSRVEEVTSGQFSDNMNSGEGD